MKRFDTVLIANRGEIAVRLIRTARQQGYRTIAVFSEADAQALHIRLADQAVAIGPAPAAASYLSIEKLIAAALGSGAQAIHPGYGFLSERADFAQAVEDAGLVFIGPDPASIEAMGNKSAAKLRMIAAGVPCVPGYQGEDQSDDVLIAEALRIGLPVMIKAASGGGGRGMRRVFDSAQLPAAIASARSEAHNAFGSGQLLIEKAVIEARHVEIQIFGDRHGQVIHLGERDCSIQRRNQKVVEEAPSPALDDELRRAMGAAAVAAAKAVNYVSAGTIEFLLDRDRRFYFLEMNTRLQVEHAVTEAVYGVDLVDWQLRIAQGERLPMTQQEVLGRASGHAIEVRLCAEDPRQNYLPQSGEVLHWAAPNGDGIRVDSGLESGQRISPYYDSMQARIIAWGEHRETARARLLRALNATSLLGVRSNLDYLRAVLGTETFASGIYTTGFVETCLPQKTLSGYRPGARLRLLAAVALYCDDTLRLAGEQGLPPELIGWHSSAAGSMRFELTWGDMEMVLEVLVRDGRNFSASIDGEIVTVTLTATGPGAFRYVVDGVQAQARYARDGNRLWLQADGQTEAFVDCSQAPAEAEASVSDGRVRAPSDGRIVAVAVQPGEAVVAGQTLAVLEAMKMEFQIVAPVAGRVESMSAAAGEQVRARQLLLLILPQS